MAGDNKDPDTLSYEDRARIVRDLAKSLGVRVLVEGLPTTTAFTLRESVQGARQQPTLYSYRIMPIRYLVDDAAPGC